MALKNHYTVAEVNSIIGRIENGLTAKLLNTVEKPMSITETASFLDYAVGTLSNKISSGEIPQYLVHKINGKTYFYASEINAWIKRNGEIENAA